MYMYIFMHTHVRMYVYVECAELLNLKVVDSCISRCKQTVPKAAVFISRLGQLVRFHLYLLSFFI